MSSSESFENWGKEPKQDWEFETLPITPPIYINPEHDWDSPPSKPIVPRRSPRYTSRKGVPKSLQEKVSVRWSGLFALSLVEGDVTRKICRTFGVVSGLYNLMVRSGIHDTTGCGDDKRRDPKGHHVTVRVYSNQDVDMELEYETIHLYAGRFVGAGKELDRLPTGQLNDNYPHWDEIEFWWDSWKDTDTLTATSPIIHNGILEMIQEIHTPGLDDLGWPIKEDWALEMDGFAPSLFEEKRLIKVNDGLETLMLPRFSEAFIEGKTFDVAGVDGPLELTIKRTFVQDKRRMGDFYFYYIAAAIKDGAGDLVMRGWRISTRFDFGVTDR